MINGVGTRGRLVAATRELVEAKGYHGTGLNEVLALAEAPRGSLYHHFPGGKDQLIREALTAASQEVDAVLAELSASAATVGDLVRALLDTLADRMVAADYAKGCPVATVALEVAGADGVLRDLCGAIYQGWQQVLVDALREAGHDSAEDLAATLLALIEGALLLARAGRSRVPIEQTGRRIDLLLGS